MELVTANRDSLSSMSTEELCINTIRTLAMDAVQRAGSGHPGTPMALAPVAFVLWDQFMRHNPGNPTWFNRDRFILSNGHASMLLYAILCLCGYRVSLSDLKNFRQWGSKTPGHPEKGVTPGVETTTGPLGQGVMSSVGMAMAEAHLASIFNRSSYPIVDHRTYALCSDGDLMEGASHEAASLAGHLGLHKLTWIYDDNHISIAGDTELATSDDVVQRFEAYHWHVQNLGERAEQLDSLVRALKVAEAETHKPSLIIIRSHIAFGAPNKQDTKEAHGSPLGEDEVRAAKSFYGWPSDAQFLVPHRALAHMRCAVHRGEEMEMDWENLCEGYRHDFPDLAKKFDETLRGGFPSEGGIMHFEPGDGPLATRKASGIVLNHLAERMPWLIGGSGDLAPSTKTLISNSKNFRRHDYSARNIRWGVREHVMCAAATGMAVHGGVRPYAATFFIFTDYARPAIRLAALMKAPVIFVMTHDSIGLGEDGPTHQPIEHLASFRAMPNIHVIRPADANETAYAWQAALERLDGPTILVLTRQKLPIFDRHRLGGAEGLLRGGYVLSRERGAQPHGIFLATGSEVQLALAAQEKLRDSRIDTRVVSLPCWEIFREQERSYRDEVLPPAVKARLAVEAGVSLGWCEWVRDDGDVVGINRFGASAPGAVNFEKFGFTADNVAARMTALLDRSAR